MVAVSHNDADDFLTRSTAQYFLYLIYGPDRGLVSERCAIVCRKLRAGQKIELSGDAVAADPLTLVDEANSIDMFQQTDRIIRISIGGKSILPALEMIAAAPPQNCLILLEGGDIRRDAPLLKWVQAQSFAAAVECRQDDAKSVLRLLDRELGAAGRTIEPSARDALLEVLGEDRIATRNEIEKLLAYTTDQATITFADVEAICHDPNRSQNDTIVDGYFLTRRQDMLELLLSALLAGSDLLVVLLALTRHALALQKGACAIESGASPGDALQITLRSVGGFNRKSEIARQLRAASGEEMLEVIRTLQNFTKAARRNPVLLSQRLTRLMMSRPSGRPTRTQAAR